MGMLHATHLANTQAFACRLQFGHADFFALFGLQAFGGSFMGGSHGAVARGVFSQLLVAVRLGKRQCARATQQRPQQTSLLHRQLQSKNTHHTDMSGQLIH
jgi:hypothetical protein